MTLAEIEKYRALAAQHPGHTSAKIINRLLDELQDAKDQIAELRKAVFNKHDAFTERTPMPFGKHKGDELQDVPQDYLRWWWSKNRDRDAIVVETDFGAWPKRIIALKKLRLHDYLKHKLEESSNAGGHINLLATGWRRAENERILFFGVKD